MILTTMLLLLSGCGFANINPNAFEDAYLAIAVDINEPELCYKINSRSVTSASPSGVPFGFITTSHRYNCFYTIARQTHNVDLCKQVKSIYNGTITQENCEREASDMKHKRYGSQPFDYELILRLLGYNDQDVMKLKRKDKDFFILYLIERDKPEFQAKLTNLPDFSTSDDRATEELYKLAPDCVDNISRNPLCFRIDCGLVRGKLDRSCWQK